MFQTPGGSPWSTSASCSTPRQSAGRDRAFEDCDAASEASSLAGDRTLEEEGQQDQHRYRQHERQTLPERQRIALDQRRRRRAQEGLVGMAQVVDELGKLAVALVGI